MNRNALAALGGILLIGCGPLHARVTRIVIDQTVSPAFCKGATCASYGDVGLASAWRATTPA